MTVSIQNERKETKASVSMYQIKTNVTIKKTSCMKIQDLLDFSQVAMNWAWHWNKKKHPLPPKKPRQAYYVLYLYIMHIKWVLPKHLRLLFCLVSRNCYFWNTSYLEVFSNLNWFCEWAQLKCRGLKEWKASLQIPALLLHHSTTRLHLKVPPVHVASLQMFPFWEQK